MPEVTGSSPSEVPTGPLPDTVLAGKTGEDLTDADLISGPEPLSFQDDWTDWRQDPKRKRDRMDGNDELASSDTDHRDSKDRKSLSGW